MPSPKKLRGPTVTTSLEQEDIGQFRSISASDVNDIDDNNDIEVISTIEAEDEEPRPGRREEEQPMTKEKRLAFKQLERWRVAMNKRSKKIRRSRLRWDAKTQAYDDEVEFDNLFGSNSSFGRELERWRVAMNKRSKKIRRSRLRWDAKTQAYDDEVEFDNLFGSNSSFGRELQVVSYPWPIWVFGVVIMLGASVFVHSVYSQRDDDDDVHERNSNWWKYLVAITIYILGFALIANGRIETFYMNKESSRLSVRSNKPLCLSRRYIRCVERDMRHITNIRVETTGEYSGDVDTRTYKVHFDFDDGTYVSALESRSKHKTMRRCRHIKQFAAVCPPAIAPLRSASEQFSPTVKKSPDSPLRHTVTSPAKLSHE
ncbi:Transmembrane protein [Phytophthora palmivora]|uniref:Transmembrane protein n=1 Tax=Phytophthora palmivora TaxID=4796 RepID=A0A2P4YTL0_9STRA|nr:Transmembrane protein [Phytophthora palmivora]